MNNRNLFHKQILVSFLFIIGIVFAFDVPDETKQEGFLAGTMVHTPRGLRRIESIHDEDLVTVYNFKRQRFSSRKVHKPIICHVEHYLILMINGEFIGTSFDHQFYVPARDEWVAARSLRVDDMLFTQSGKPAVIQAILEVKKHTDLYSLIVERKHNFLVSSQGIVVHNFIVVPFMVTWGAGLGAEILWSIMLETCLSNAALYLASTCLPKSKPCHTCFEFMRNNWQPVYDINMRSPCLPEPQNISTDFTIDTRAQHSLDHLSGACGTFGSSPRNVNGIDVHDMWTRFIQSYDQPMLNSGYFPSSLLGTDIKEDGLIVTRIPPSIDQPPINTPPPLSDMLNRPQVLINVPTNFEQGKDDIKHIFPIPNDALHIKPEGILIPEQNLHDHIYAMGKNERGSLGNDKSKPRTEREEQPRDDLTQKEQQHAIEQLGTHKKDKSAPAAILKETKGRPVFKNTKKDEWISYDSDGHNGGTWKVFNRHGRIGTYSKDLKMRYGK